LGCSKDDTEVNRFNGQATAFKNGSLFNANVRFDEIISQPGLFSLHLDVYNEQGFWRENLFISRLENVFAEQEIVSNGFDEIDGPSSNYATLIDDGDVIGDTYNKLNPENNNYFRFTKYDASNGEIEGEFSISLILTSDDGVGETPTDTLRFSEGRFSAKAERSWFE